MDISAGSANGLRGFGVLVFLCLVVASAVTVLDNSSKNLTCADWKLVFLADAPAVFADAEYSEHADSQTCADTIKPTGENSKPATK